MSLRIIITLILIISVAYSEEVEEIDTEVENISEFLIKLIEKYDVSGIGAIPVDKYPSFLYDVFLTGNAVSKSRAQVDDSSKQLLLLATTQFTTKYNTTEVGIQEFYMDLVKDFTIFLTQHQNKYASIIDIFFTDTPKEQKESAQQQNQEESVEL